MQLRTLALTIGVVALTASAASAQESVRKLPTIQSPATPALNGEFKARYAALPYKGGTPDEHIMLQAAAGSTIPLWKGTATVKTKTYKYTMVGKDPAKGNSPKIPTIIIPIKLVFNSFGGATFDPTAADATCSPKGTALLLTQKSPIFNDITLAHVGTGQYVSLFQRANYFTINKRYTVELQPTTLGVQQIGVNGGNVQNTPCGMVASLDIGAWDNYVQNTLMPALSAQITPATFPIFLFYNVVLTDNGGCCILGYHSAFNNPSFGGAFQTYSTSDYDSSQAFTGGGSTTSDVSVLTHEVAEWLDDPNIGNKTPAWGHIGQVSGCQGNLEVGDPLSGTVSTVNLSGMTYHLQDLAFTSWFYQQDPPTSYNGRYSMFGTLRKFAQRCR